MASRFRRARRRVTDPLVNLAGRFIHAPYRLCAASVWRTSRVEEHGVEALRQALATRGGVILIFYHENLLLTPYAMRNFSGVALTTPVAAGTLVAGILRGFGYDVVRSRKRDPSGTLDELSRVMHAKRGYLLALAADGPSGPRRVVKPGAAILARSLKFPVFTLYFGLRRFVNYPSWDRCQLPLPFNEIAMRVDPVDTDGATRIRKLRYAIQDQMDLTARLAKARILSFGKGSAKKSRVGERRASP